MQKKYIIMKKIILTLIVLKYAIIAFGQKPAIDTSILGKWPSVERPIISDDGKYVSYIVNNISLGRASLIVTNVNGSWKREISLKETFPDFFFSSNSKYLIYKNVDSLFFISLGKSGLKVISNIVSFKHNRGNWLAYKMNTLNEDLILCDLMNMKNNHFHSVNDYSFDANGNGLIIVTDSSHTLTLINLKENKDTPIWTSKNSKCVSYNFDNAGRQLVFKVEEQDTSNAIYSIWYYKYGAGNARALVHNKSLGIPRNLYVDGLPEFSQNGRWVFFSLRQMKRDRRPLENATMVDIWSYKDLIIQPEQRRLLSIEPHAFAAAIGVDGNRIIRIEQEDEMLQTYPDQITGDFVVVEDHHSNSEYGWTLSPQPSYYLLSLQNGSRRIMKKENRSLCNFSFSPKGRYLVYYDYREGHYFSMDLQSGKVTCITSNLTAKVATENIKSIVKEPIDEVAGWQEDESSLLLYDEYDIWKLDPTGERAPVNTTDWHGSKKHIKFRIIGNVALTQRGNFATYNNNEQLLLTAFNIEDKYNGFYKMTLDNKEEPQLLTMGPYTYYRTESQKSRFYSFDDGMRPIKAKKGNIWVVKRQSATEAPNFFVTKNFKTFSPVSNLHPQSEVNWIHTELITWKMLNGQTSKGVLYKPEDFDPKKKYPVIFNYYERLSHTLYEFPYPAFSSENINIPWFVSNGYLVFRPDIPFKIARESDTTFGEWAYNSVVSAAKYLSNLPYVNGAKMGIQGHSFGGGETNYIVTHTGLFAAAVDAAGQTDAISCYLSLTPFVSSIEHHNPQPGIENGHSLTGATPWERPDLYKKSSPVLYADRVTTPLLIMHNEKDNQIPWRQGVEFYMALRRLGKKVWMLQYDSGGHCVYGNNAVDYTLRLTQFFDYYLKDGPAPIWMTKGVLASEKGIENGFKIDTSGQVP